uniref:5-azacytidine-induced protein 1 n=2 Tax=Tetraselmis sp. GSL018 TaxID=582737 RepID=A0A061RE31_9CHLO
MAGLQQQAEAHARRVEELEGQLQAAEARADAGAKEAEERAAAQLQQQQEESKCTIARHLEFIDRLLADKESLSAKCTSLASEMESMESRHEAAVAALKDRWAAELKRQKEAWAAAEKIKRDSWAEEKAKEVKEMTIKGLEPEIQRLIAKHKADMRKLEQRLSEEAQSRVDAKSREHEEYARQLRDRLLKEREDTVEKERIAAAERVRDVNERHEMQQQQQRQRLLADADARVEEVERQRRSERQRLESALEKARDEALRKEEELRSAMEAQKKELKREHDRALAEARGDWDAQQQGWRTFVAERAEKEVAECEKQLRKELAAERDKQIEAIMDKLEDESAAAKERLEEEFLAKEEALVEKHRKELQNATAEAEKAAEKNRALVRAKQESEKHLSEAEDSIQELKRELSKKKTGTIEWMANQLNDSKQGWESKAQELREGSRRNEEAMQRKLDSKDRELAKTKHELWALHERLEDLQARKATEMEHVESRVRAAIARKDDSIQKLKKENEAVTQELQRTKELLYAQKQAFCS